MVDGVIQAASWHPRKHCWAGPAVAHKMASGRAGPPALSGE